MVRFCLSIDHGDWVRAHQRGEPFDTIALAQRADRLGLDSLWISEDPDGWDAFALLGALSQQTDQIRLGTGVTNPYFRHPSLIAASVATIDQLSAGRAFLGLGRGEPDLYQETFRFERGNPLARLETTVGLLRDWWEPPWVATADGELFVDEWQRSIGPVSRPPIYLAATGPKALALAGRVADGVLFNALATDEFLVWAIGQAKSAAETCGRNPDELSFFANPELTLTDDPENVLEKRKSIATLIHALPGMDRQLMSSDYDVEAIMTCVRLAMHTDAILADGGHFAEMRAQGDRETARKCLPTGLIEAASITGDERHVAARLETYEDIGVTHVFLNRTAFRSDPDRFEAFSNSRKGEK